MPSFDTTTYAAQKSTRANTSRLSEKTSFVYKKVSIVYTCAGTEVSGDTLNLLQIPAGSIPTPDNDNVVVQVDPCSSTLTANIGTDASAAGWGSALNLASVGRIPCCASGAAGPAYAVPTALTADSGDGGVTSIRAVLTAGATLTAGGQLIFNLSWHEPAGN